MDQVSPALEIAAGRKIQMAAVMVFATAHGQARRLTLNSARILVFRLRQNHQAIEMRGWPAPVTMMERAIPLATWGEQRCVTFPLTKD